MRAVLRGRSGGNASGTRTRTRTRPRAGKSNARLCDDHPKRSRSDPGERGEKHRSRQAETAPVCRDCMVGDAGLEREWEERLTKTTAAEIPANPATRRRQVTMTISS